MRASIMVVAVVAFSAALLSIGCLDGSPLGPLNTLQHAAATNSCAPNDGPAVWIALSGTPFSSLTPPFPFVSVMLYRSPSALVGKSWPVGATAGEGMASYNVAIDASQPATSGTVEVTRVNDDGSIEGTFELTFTSVAHYSGSFKAPWIPSLILCG